MKVRAIKMGYYNHIRQREGVEFTLTDSKHFSSKWMERVNGESAQDTEESISEKRPRGNPNWKRR